VGRDLARGRDADRRVPAAPVHADDPDELLDAARMDHASEWQIYWRIVLPLTRRRSRCSRSSR
jgi:ABC-type sulfate transport system permease component